MDPKLKAFLSELIPLLEKHEAFLAYTIDDDGVWVGVGDDRWDGQVNLGFTANGRSEQLTALKRELGLQE